jgi:hypothetical protein
MQRDPAVFLWPSVFLKAWGTKANKPHLVFPLTTRWFTGLAAEGGKAPNQYLFTNMFVCFSAAVPQAFKQPFAPKATL